MAARPDSTLRTPGPGRSTDSVGEFGTGAAAGAFDQLVAFPLAPGERDRKARGVVAPLAAVGGIVQNEWGFGQGLILFPIPGELRLLGRGAKLEVPTPRGGGKPKEVSELIKLKVDGMTCDHCVMAVTKALKGVPGVERVVEVSLERGEALVEGNPNLDALIEAIREEGYEAKPADA